MNTVFNTQENPVILSGYPGPGHYSAAERTARRNRMDPANVERAAALYFAELAALRLDREFFRRELPPGGSDDALVLTLIGEQPSDAGTDYREFRFRLTGMDADADRLKRRMMRIAGAAELAACVTISSRRITESVTFSGWVFQPVTFSVTADAGRCCYAGEMPFTGTVCLTPPEPIPACI